MRLIDADALMEEIARRDTTDGTIKVFSGREVNEIAANMPTIEPNVFKWVTIGERLPEDTKPKVVSRRNGLMEVDSYEDDGWFYDDVVAWMPLPEPYVAQEWSENEQN